MNRVSLWVVAVAAVVAAPVGVRAEVPAAALDAAKKAAVRLKVTAGGKVTQGSGFFAAEPGVVLTTASIAGMLDPSSPPPEKVEVFLDGTRPVTGEVLGVDPVSNLAAIRVKGDNLPAPLKLATTAATAETQDVYLVGYPPPGKDKEIGKDVTVTKATVVGFRKLTTGAVSTMLIDKGTNFGNNGGPILSAAGEVVAVATNGKALPQASVPAEVAAAFLNGRVTGLTVELAFKDGANLKVPYRLSVNDPLKKLQAVEILFWMGKPGALRPASETEPKPLPDDAGFQAFKIPVDGSNLITGELTLPPRPEDQAYWFRTVYTAGDEKRHWRAALNVRPNPVDRVPVKLAYKPKAVQYVELTSDAELKLRESSGETHTLKMNVHPKFREQRVGEANPARFVHNYTGLNFSINMDNVPMNKDSINKMLPQLRNVTSDVEMAADGGVEKAKANVSKVPPGPREDMEIITDQILQTFELMALPLPDGEIKPLQNWKAQRVIDIGPSFASVSSLVDVKYTYLGVSQQAGKSLAVFEMKGPVKAKRGDGVNIRGNLDGTARVDTETGEVVSTKLTVKADMEIKLEKSVMTAHGEVAMTLKRSETPPAPPKKP